jgi:hypothetical protein
MRTMATGASMVPPDPSKMSPGDRIQQLGEAGTTMLLNALVTGVGINNADKVIVVDLRPCINAQWLKTCHLGQLDWSSNVASVYGFPAYCGIDIEDPAVSSTIRTDATELLISSWWDTCPEAGSKEPTDLASSIVKPVLSFMTWDATSGKPEFPHAVRSKFGDDSGYQAEWTKLMESCVSQIGGLVAVSAHNAVNTNAALSDPIDPPRVHCSAQLAEAVDFNDSDVFLCLFLPPHARAILSATLNAHIHPYLPYHIHERARAHRNNHAPMHTRTR